MHEKSNRLVVFLFHPQKKGAARGIHPFTGAAQRA
jgi:hypothetical protein